MRITKFQHACFVLEQDGQTLVVDPGEWTKDFVVPENVVAIVVTHVHQDHMESSLIGSIVEKNPDATIVGHSDVVSKLGGYHTKLVNAGETANLGNFNMEFYGGEHATIAPDRPVISNLGVLINENVYYGGDSFSAPNKQVQNLALPVSAPWMKYSEAVEFLQNVKPVRAFPTHDAILSDVGKELADNMMAFAAEKIGARYERLPFGETVEL